MSPLPTLAPRQPGNRPQAVEGVFSKEHTEEEWQAKKELIRRLYIEDNRKLNDTMAILESKYGFSATEQMYKKRLKKWNIRKRAYRKSQQDSSASSPATNSEVAEFNESTDLDVEEVPRQQPGGTAVSLTQPSRLGPYASLELVLDSVFSWSQGKLDSHRVTSDPMSKYLANPNQPPIQDSRTMYRTFELAFDLWYYGKGDLAGMAARKGFFVLEFVLTEDHPDLIWHILDTIYDMVDRGHLRLLALFLEHANVIAHRQLPANHPLSRILQQLGECDYRTHQGRQFVCHLLRQIWLRNVDLLSSRIGSLVPQHLWLYEQLIWDGRTRLRKNSELARQREPMIKALRSLATHQGNTCDNESDRLRIEALMLEFTQMDLKDRLKAEELTLDLLHRTETGTSSRSSARFHAYARKMLARLYEQREEWEGAEKNLRWAISKREAAHGANNNLRVVRDMWVLAAHFQRAGRPVDADQIAQDAIARAQRYLQDGPG